MIDVVIVALVLFLLPLWIELLIGIAMIAVDAFDAILDIFKVILGTWARWLA